MKKKKENQNKVVSKGVPKLYNRESGESMMEYMARMMNRTEEEKVNDDRKDKLDWILEE